MVDRFDRGVKARPELAFESAFRIGVKTLISDPGSYL